MQEACDSTICIAQHKAKLVSRVYFVHYAIYL